ncbi:MAG: hypothetical protein ACI4UH_07145 [Dorea sp.]
MRHDLKECEKRIQPEDMGKGSLKETIDEAITQIDITIEKLLAKKEEFVGQFICLYFINVEILGGLYYDIDILGMKFELVQQSLALIAMYA